MSAERKTQPGIETVIAEEPPEQFALKQQVAERLAAHRSRRGRQSDAADAQPSVTATPSRARIAAAVAERYAQSQSYRAFLAEEAERAIRQAEAAAEVAARNAEAVAQAQYKLLEELDQYVAGPAAPTHVPPSTGDETLALKIAEAAPETPPAQLDLRPAPSFTAASFTVRMAEEIRRHDAAAVQRANRSHAREIVGAVSETVDPSEALSLDEEIAFRQAPVFEPVEPPVAIPANLIEFPRQLVASRRARPRLAEGPLRAESEAEHDVHQMRIFEVEAEQISSVSAVETAAPEWTSILLDAQPRGSVATTVDAAAHASYAAYDYSPNRPVEYATAGERPAQHLEHNAETRHLYAVPFEVAPLGERAMAAAVDCCAVLAACMIFVAGAVMTASRFAPGGLHVTFSQAALIAAVTFAVLGFAYQYLCFTFSDATPGMRYARIGLCTFADDNPTRAAMRRRIGALVLSAAPIGLGLLWSLLDEDRLGWHDRISRMYQRSY